MTLTDGVLYDDYEQKCDECRRLRAELERLKKELRSHIRDLTLSKVDALEKVAHSTKDGDKDG